VTARRPACNRARPPATPVLPPMPPQLRSGTCASHPQPALWQSPLAAEQEAARHLCCSCPALVQCRAWSLSLRTADDQTGVLGGLTPQQRALARRARQRALRKATAA